MPWNGQYHTTPSLSLTNESHRLYQETEETPFLALENHPHTMMLTKNQQLHHHPIWSNQIPWGLPGPATMLQGAGSTCPRRGDRLGYELLETTQAQCRLTTTACQATVLEPIKTLVLRYSITLQSLTCIVKSIKLHCNAG